MIEEDSYKPGIRSLFFSVFLPLMALVVELNFFGFVSGGHMGPCGSIFFDPLPDSLSILAVSLMPIINLYSWLCIRRIVKPEYHMAIPLSAISISISAVYSAMFIIVSPVMLLAIMFFGIGLLGLSPMFSLFYAIKYRKALLNNSTEQAQTTIPMNGWVLSVAFILIWKSSFLINQGVLPLIKSEVPVVKKVSKRLVYMLGDEIDLLRDCWQLSGQEQIDAQKLYFTIYGKSHKKLDSYQNTKIFDAGRSRRFRSIDPSFNEYLHLQASRLDISADTAAGVAYGEWIIEIENRGYRSEEGKGLIRLPKGAVASRLTLWVNGEEREAAYATKSHVTRAYQNIVSQNRDPVLLNYVGPDVVEFRCFPILPKGSMKFKVGFSFPLHLQGNRLDQVSFYEPQFTEVNFNISKKIKTKLWIDGVSGSKPGDMFTIREANSILTTSDLGVQHNLPRDANLKGGYFIDNRTYVNEVTLLKRESNNKELTFVIDGSNAMNIYKDKIVEAFRHLKSSVEIKVHVASYDVMTFPKKGYSDNYNEVADFLESISFEGGMDNNFALDRAIEDSINQKNRTIIWIHNPQDILLSSLDNIVQKLERRPNSFELIDIPMSQNKDVVLPYLKRYMTYSTARISQNVSESLKKIIEKYFDEDTNKSKKYKFVAKTMYNKKSLTLYKKTSSHLKKLVLFHNVIIPKLLEGPFYGSHPSIVNLAIENRLITPATGAVVLETQEMYDQAGLKPVGKESVPSIPEPETWAFIFCLFLLLIYLAKTNQLNLNGNDL